MKRFFILFVLITFVFVCFTQANEIHFEGFKMGPATLADITMYDYSNGGYNGYPMRFQGEDVGGSRGIYFTYMVQIQGQQRLQHWAFSDLEGQMEGKSQVNPNNTSHQEGFGTLAIDPATGNPIFAWHAFALHHSPPISTIVSNYFLWDQYDWFNSPGIAMSEAAMFVDAENYDEGQRFMPIWPVIYYGPSPIAGKNRIYAFFNSSSSSFQVNPGADNGFMPSSRMLIAFADIGAPEYSGSSSMVVWTEKTVDYLDRMHFWNPDYIAATDTYPTARAFLSYTVAPAGNLSGYVAVAGQVTTNSDVWTWTDLPPHDHIVILSKDYGDTFTLHPGMLEHALEPSFKFTYDPSELANYSNEIQEDAQSNWNTNFSDKDGWKATDALLNNKTIVFDKLGRLHIPSWSGPGWSAGSWWPQASAVEMLMFDPNSNQYSVSHVHPKPKVPMDKFVFSFDLNNDGFIDVNIYTDNQGNEYLLSFPPNLPIFWHDYNHAQNPIFNHNQIRMTYDGNETMALIWTDSSKAFENARAEIFYPGYRDTPEIMISISVDMGATWSDPFRFSYLDMPELSLNPAQYNPSFIYPADKLFREKVGDKDLVHVYFMYNDDFYYGSSVHQQGNPGTAIRFAGMTFNVSGLSEGSPEIPAPKAMLSQNYPNPFNPSTTIKFDIPKGGDVKLSVYNVRGQLVKNLVDSNLPAGAHSVVWSGVDNQNRSVASGVYFYRIETDGRTENRRMVLMK